jgi:hypothetical protein
MAEVVLETGLLSDTRPAKPIVVTPEGSFARGLVMGILLSVPAWAAIAAALVFLLL